MTKLMPKCSFKKGSTHESVGTLLFLGKVKNSDTGARRLWLDFSTKSILQSGFATERIFSIKIFKDIPFKLS